MQLTQVNYVSFVHMLHALADLAHVVDDLRFAHRVAFCRDALEEFSPRETGIHSVVKGFAGHATKTTCKCPAKPNIS